MTAGGISDIILGRIRAVEVAILAIRMVRGLGRNGMPPHHAANIDGIDRDLAESQRVGHFLDFGAVVPYVAKAAFRRKHGAREGTGEPDQILTPGEPGEEVGNLQKRVERRTHPVFKFVLSETIRHVFRGKIPPRIRPVMGVAVRNRRIRRRYPRPRAPRVRGGIQLVFIVGESLQHA